MMLLKCPKCKSTMKYQPLFKPLRNKRKQCVYCGKSFLVSDYIVEKDV